MAFTRSRVVRMLILLVGLLAMASLGAGFMFYMTFIQDLPDLHSVEDYRPPISSQVLDRDGVPIATYFEQRRRLTPFEAVPTHVVMAFVSGEDSAFFEHSGIDYASIVRAAWVNLRAGGEIKQGASTITQQMVKGLLLTPERNFRRKIREMILARRIEQRFSKEEILYLYLNQIYFGHGAYGIGEAAETYFGKPVGELTISEGAMLAGLPKAPSRYSPFRNPDRSEERRLYVLSRMHADDIIDTASYQAAVAQAPILADVDVTRDDPKALYFTEEVRRYLFESLGGDQVLRGGLTIETTLAVGLQYAAVDAVRQGLQNLDRRQGYRGPVRRVADEAIADEVQRVAVENELVSAPDPDSPQIDSDPVEHPPELDESIPELSALDVAIQDASSQDVSIREKARARLAEPAGVLLGVVTQVNSAEKTARVAFAPGVEGIVKLADVSWARESDPKRSPYAVRSIAKVFARGDVAPFSSAPDSSESAESTADADGTSEPLRVTLHQDPIVQGALLSLDVNTDEVLALVGGYDFAQSQFNRVTQARRQPGSAFKPIIYAAALATKSDPDAPIYTPATIIYDRPIVYTDKDSGFIWRPRNYKRSFYGPITLREALARSINNATVHLFRDIGMDFVIDYSRRLGIESPLSRDLSLALGSSDVSLLEMTRAYAVFPAGGRRRVPTLIRRVTDRDGNVLLENIAVGSVPQPPTSGDDSETADFAELDAGSMPDAIPAPQSAEGEPQLDSEQVITPEDAYLAVALLRAVVDDQHGTGWRLRALGRPLAGKTGTTNEQGDAWFIGFSPDITTGVWVGHDESRYLGYGETGSRAAAPIWVDYMKVALEERPKRDFPVPDPIVFARIDRKSGLLADASSADTVFEAFREGTVPSETANSKRASTESRRQLRLDSF
jgi:penicillin-binding protein 1A